MLLSLRKIRLDLHLPNLKVKRNVSTGRTKQMKNEVAFASLNVHYEGTTLRLLQMAEVLVGPSQECKKENNRPQLRDHSFFTL